MSLLSSSGKMQYNQPALSIAEQLALLQSKGLVIEDLSAASHFLSHISYFRFKHYSYTFKDYSNGGIYREGTTFNSIKRLYLFDRDLKLAVFSAIENIEVSVKAHVSNIMSARHGPHWYLQTGLFISAGERREVARNSQLDDGVIKRFDHAKFLRDIQSQLRDPPEIFLQHYLKNYTPVYPPSWMLMEMITFSTLSIMFENLKASDEKNAIIESFDLTKKHLTSWLHCFSFIRNKCAHHARLVYAPIILKPSLPQRRSRQFLAEADLVNNNSLYAVLCCIGYLAGICNSQSLFKQHIVMLMNTFPEVDNAALGFTANWQKEAIWQ